MIKLSGVSLELSKVIKITSQTAEEKAARVKAMKEMDERMAQDLRASEQRVRETGVQESNEIYLPNIIGLNLTSANTVRGFVELMIQENREDGKIVHARFGEKASNNLSQYLVWINEYIDSDAASYTPTPAPSQKPKPE